MIDDTISWKYHIPYICSRVSRGIGIFSKLRQYLSSTQLKQLYYNIIYPRISYAITAWGSTYKSNLFVSQHQLIYIGGHSGAIVTRTMLSWK